MAAETLVIPRAGLDMEELWSTPPVCNPVRLRRATDAAAPRLATSVAGWFDDEYVTFLFSGADDHMQATHLTHDAPLYEEDVVELFLAPDSLSHYFEIEVSPRGTVFDARIDSPDGDRRTMHVDRAWTCEGLLTAVRRLSQAGGGTSLDTLVRVPFRAFSRRSPRNGETWRANFFRVDRHPQLGDEYSAWQPTLRDPADFHVPAAFGTMLFSE